ncbi:DODA-type extradiol aromatic ring-opening family dioxygenase [Allosphingosinicella vermicomposti]|uniref:DODA-type extradiol aromatic ring-opening family dioxygenase n=1 Tax=Allosphingosinicella vermicomposti TaxID=614671 RepID=UPI000D0ED8B3|nr:class III extradiol ring-cleavage dioxygenase [Allosphingosinicella vermicomposti]
MLPALFVSHGAPTFPLTDVPARHFLEGLAAELGERPEAIIVVSAHWETAQPMVNAVERNETIHDFYGFPPELYALTYPAPGSIALADRIQSLLLAGGVASGCDERRGLDHGAWVPLRLIYPGADIPVVQISVQPDLGPEHHVRIGRLLAPLRSERVLILASGSFTHDLSSFRDYYDALHAPEPEWVTRFAEWMDAALTDNRRDDLTAYRAKAPEATRNHPTEEHLLPLFVAMGASDGKASRLHQSTLHGILRMDAYAFM